MKLRKPAGTLLNAMADDPARKRLTVDRFFDEDKPADDEPLAKIPLKGEEPPQPDEQAPKPAEPRR